MVKKSLKEIADFEIKNFINETYESINEIKKFANDVIYKLAETNYEFLNHSKVFNYLYGFELSDFKNVTNKYPVLKSFIENTYLSFNFSPSKEPTKMGEYGIFNNSKEREINIYYNYDALKEDIDNLLKDKNYKITAKDLYFKIFNKFYSSLIHEIQHAYDDYRTKGKLFSNVSKEQFLNTTQKDEKRDINGYLESDKKYLNLPYEIWARFSQTIADLHFTNINFVDDNSEDGSHIEEKMKDLNDLIKEFTKKFNYFSALPEDQKKKLLGRVSAYWHKEQEKLNAINK